MSVMKYTQLAVVSAHGRLRPGIAQQTCRQGERNED
jgi:hypothetical protein